MKATASGGGDFEQCPTGTHAARCVRIIDIGTQVGEYQGQKTSRRQFICMWELPLTKQSEGERAGMPFLVSKFYTLSVHEKSTLRADLKNWRGKDLTPAEAAGFDPKVLLLKTCMVSVTSTEAGKSKVTGVMALPQGMTVPEQVYETILFDLDEYNPDTFDKISKGLQKMIINSPEFEIATGGKPLSTTHSDRDAPVGDEVDPFLEDNW